jgi:hypothetical protein
VAEVFISHTSSDRDWAFWIAKELEALGHIPHVDKWEIKGGDDIYAWMQDRFGAADHVLCVVSDEYLKAPYSTVERNAALWQAARRPGFVLAGSGEALPAAGAFGPIVGCCAHAPTGHPAAAPRSVMKSRRPRVIRSPRRRAAESMAAP